MPARSYTIQNATGLHARPARIFAETAAGFACAVRVRKGAKVVNGKSVLSMLTLGAKHLDTLVIETEGQGADEALAALGEIAGKLFVD
jgi:phosphocarrier protein HPr